MAEISEKERKERKLKKHSNPDDLKVIFRCDPMHKKRLDEMAFEYGATMTDIILKGLDDAWKHYLDDSGDFAKVKTMAEARDMTPDQFITLIVGMSWKSYQKKVSK
jgi:hypothetical protein